MNQFFYFMKRICVVVFLVLLTSSVFATTTDLAIRFLDKANEAFEKDNIEDAYKYVNQALAVAKDEASQASVLFFAQTVYKQKLQKLQEHYDEMALIDIKKNLEKYPNLENSTIKKLLKQLESGEYDATKIDSLKNTNIAQIVRNLNSMNPQIVADILVAMDDYTIIEILRKEFEIAEENGTSSNGAYWLSLMPTEKAETLQRKMLIKPDLNDVDNTTHISQSEKKQNLTSFNGISFGASRNEAKKIMVSKGWKLDSSHSDKQYNSDTYINGTYAGIEVSYICLYFFNDQLWQGYVQIKTENHDAPDRIIDKLQTKYGLVGYQLKDSSKNCMHLKAVDPSNNNWIDIRITVINDKKYWYWYDINFYSDELYKIQETYNMVDSVNKLNVHEDDL